MASAWRLGSALCTRESPWSVPVARVRSPAHPGLSPVRGSRGPREGGYAGRAQVRLWFKEGIVYVPQKQGAHGRGGADRDGRHQHGGSAAGERGHAAVQPGRHPDLYPDLQQGVRQLRQPGLCRDRVPGDPGGRRADDLAQCQQHRPGRGPAVHRGFGVSVLREGHGVRHSERPLRHREGGADRVCATRQAHWSVRGPGPDRVPERRTHPAAVQRAGHDRVYHRYR